MAVEVCDKYWAGRFLGLVGHLISNTRKSATFLDLNVRDLCCILSSDHLDVPRERHIFCAAYTWLHHDIAGRLPDANTVLRCVRYGLMNSEDLVKCALFSRRLQKIVMAIPAYQEALLKACVAKNVFRKMPASSDFKQVAPRIKNDPTIYHNNQSISNDECLCNQYVKFPLCHTNPSVMK